MDTMGEKNWLEQIQGENQLAKIIEANTYTEEFGLALTDAEARALVEKRNEARGFCRNSYTRSAIRIM